MGLSGRKVKQRIGADPRNLAWADDAAKFGQSYLSKFGWDSSKGLGVAGDGRLSHIKVSHKLDMLGIGAGHQDNANGIAWKQNKDFENLLKRLNEGLAAENKETNVDVEHGDKDEAEVQEKKRKYKKDEGDDEKQAKKKIKKSEEGENIKSEKATIKVDEVKEPSPVPTTKPYVPRHRAHRARAIASKHIASKSSAAISEILGIAPTPSSAMTSSSSGTPQGTLTPLDDVDTLEKITTSTKSVADYFKERLLAKSSKAAGSSTSNITSSNSTTDDDMSYEQPRGGLGSSRLRVEVTEESLDAVTHVMGMSKFSSLLSSSFLAAASLPIASRESLEEEAQDDSGAESEHTRRKKEKKEKKEKRRKEKESLASSVQTDKGDNNVKRTKEERRKEKAAKKAHKETRQREAVNDHGS